MFGTFKFELGQQVELVNLDGRSIGVFSVQQRLLDHQHERHLYTLRGPGVGNGQYSEDQLRAIPPVCIVCNQRVVVKDNLVQEHNFQGHLCYGSFMPQDAVPYEEKLYVGQQYQYNPQQYQYNPQPYVPLQ
jgi:hypothetical protein